MNLRLVVDMNVAPEWVTVLAQDPSLMAPCFHRESVIAPLLLRQRDPLGVDDQDSLETPVAPVRRLWAGCAENASGMIIA